MINFDDVTKENINEDNPNWSQISDHPYNIIIIRKSGSGKTNVLFNLMCNRRDMDKIYLQAKDIEIIPETLIYWVGVQQDQSYLMGRKCHNKNTLWGI